MPVEVYQWVTRYLESGDLHLAEVEFHAAMFECVGFGDGRAMCADERSDLVSAWIELSQFLECFLVANRAADFDLEDST